MFASYSDTEKRTAEIMDTDDGKIPNYCQVLRFKDANGQIKEMVFPKALDLDRPKRPRTTFSDNQLSILEKEFQKNPYLIGKDRTRLAATLELTETQIKVWFQNRRTKSKKDKTGVDGEKDKTLDNLAESRPWSSSPVCPNSPKLPNGKSLGSVASMKMPLSLSEECKARVNGQYLSQLPIPVQAQMQNPLQMYSSNFSPLPYMYPMFPVTQVLRR